MTGIIAEDSRDGNRHSGPYSSPVPSERSRDSLTSPSKRHAAETLRCQVAVIIAARQHVFNILARTFSLSDP